MSKGKRKAVAHTRDKEALVKAVSDQAVEWLRAERKRKGLPPLPKS